MARSGLLSTLALLVAGALAPAVAAAQDAPPACTAPLDITRLTQPLAHTAKRLAAGFDQLTVVAIGSSSTAGAGASSPAASYPSRLAVELGEQLRGHPLEVINRGVNGEEARDMLARFDDSVIKHKPDLVLWQVGTNAVLRDYPLAPAGELIQEGVKRIKQIDADVVLIDPQFAPKVIAKPVVGGMVDLISAAAKEANVDVFQRFAVMRHWHETQQIPFSAFVSPDELHMNDWSYACLAKLIGASIVEAATRGVASASARRAAP
jgi:lysophospholipase L1-like esterase